MPSLLLISSTKNGFNVRELKAYITDALPENEFLEAWMDPLGIPRAVVMLKANLDLEQIYMSYRRCTPADVFQMIEECRPTNSVLVKTHNCLTFGVVDKLKYLLSSKQLGGSTVVAVRPEPSQDDCFEIFYQNWDAVLKASKGTWKAENCRLTVVPYFETFKEPYQLQQKRFDQLIYQHKHDTRTSVSQAPNQEKTNVSLPENPVSTLNDKETVARPPLVNSYFVMILQCLHFEQVALLAYNTQVKFSEAPLRIELAGSVHSVKRVQKLLDFIDDELSHHSAISEFFSKKTVQEGLKKLLVPQNLRLEVIQIKGKDNLQVILGKDEKIIFCDFIPKLVIVKACQALPSREATNDVQWKEFVKSFDQKYLLQFISVKDVCVSLMALAQDAPDVNTQIYIINNVISQLESSRINKPGDSLNDPEHGVYGYPGSGSSKSTDFNSESISQKTKNITLINDSSQMRDASSVYNSSQMRVAAPLHDSSQMRDAGPLHKSSQMRFAAPLHDSSQMRDPGPLHKSSLMRFAPPLHDSSQMRDAHSEYDSSQMREAMSVHDSRQMRVAAPLHDSSQMRVAATLRDSSQMRVAAPLHDSSQMRDAHSEYDSSQMRDAVPLHESSQMRVSAPLHDSSQRRDAISVYESSQLRDAGRLHDSSQIRDAISVYDSRQTRDAAPLHDSSQTRNAGPLHDRSQLRDAGPLHKSSQVRVAVPLHDSSQLRDAGSLHYSSQLRDAGPLHESSQVRVAVPLYDSSQVRDAGPLHDSSQLRDAGPLHESSQVRVSAPLYDSSQIRDSISVNDRSQNRDTTSLIDSKQTRDATYESTQMIDATTLYDSPQNIDATSVIDSRQTKDASPENDSLQNKGSFVKSCNSQSFIGNLANNHGDFQHGISEKPPSQKKAAFFPKNTLLLCIFNKLNMEEAAKSTFSDLHIHINEGIEEIRLEGSPNLLKSLKYAFINEENKLKQVLSDPRLLHLLRSDWTKDGWKIIFEDNFTILVAGPEGVKISLEKFLQEHAWTLDLPVVDRNSQDQWLAPERPLETFEQSLFPCHHFLPCYPHIKADYCLKFLSQEISNMANQSNNLHIKREHNGYTISSFDRSNVDNVFQELKNLLDSLIVLVKDFTFPGLERHLKNDGSSLIDSLDEHHCLLEITDEQHSQSHAGPPNKLEASEAPRICYKATLLRTAKCNGFNLHFFEGDLTETDSDMKIVLQLSFEDSLCSIKSHRSNNHIILDLPPWKELDNVDATHLEDLRDSFQDSIATALDQAEHLKSKTVILSTACLTKAEFPFPANVIAKTIVETLFDKCDCNSASPAASRTLDFYVCIDQAEVLFKAFSFFLKLRSIPLSAPDQAAWGKISQSDKQECLNYKELPYCPEIKVLSNASKLFVKDTCFFYPINPALDADKCPAAKDPACAEFKFKTCLGKLQKAHPDGLLPAECFPLECFNDDRHAFVYCCPEWRMGIEKIIRKILEACIEKLLHFESIVIIPPGMQLLSQYPESFLAQQIFNKLDILLHKYKAMLHSKKIIFLVQNKKFETEFETELNQRQPKKQDIGYIQRIKNWWTSSDEKDSGSKQKKTVMFPRTHIRFCGRDQASLQKAIMSFEAQLRKLMKQNTITFSMALDPVEFQNIFKDFPELNVKITYHEEIKEKKKKKKKKKLKKMLFVKLEALSQENLNEVINFIKNNGQINILGDVSEKTSKLKPPTGSKEKEKESQDALHAVSDRMDEDVKMEHATLIKMASFKWMEQITVDAFEVLGIHGNDMEEAYYHGCKKEQNWGGRPLCLDFQNMRILENDMSRGIFRTEVFDIGSPMSNLADIHKLGQPFELKELTKDSPEYGDISMRIYSSQHSLIPTPTKIFSLRNEILQSRFSFKFSQLKNSVELLWHRPSRDSLDLIAKYGLHQSFSDMPGQYKQNGVLFVNQAEKCWDPLTNHDTDMWLVAARVLPGNCVQGDTWTRYPPNTEEMVDSITDGNGSFKLFSDAQAYPAYFVHFNLLMRNEATQNLTANF